MLLADKIRLKDQTLKRAQWRYGVAVALIALFSISAFVFNQAEHHKQDNDFETINLSGRQRMLSQRVALLHARGEKEKMMGAFNEFKQGLAFLQRSRFLKVGFAPEVRGMYVRPGGINELTQELGSLISQQQASSEDNERIYAISQLLLRNFDQATAMKQQISEMEHYNFISYEVVFLVVTLLLLGLEICFIFHPMIKDIRESFRKLLELEAKALENSRLAVIGEASASIGHEMANSLNVINSSAQLLLGGDKKQTSDSTTSMLKIIDRHIDKISVLLNAMRAQARLSSHDPLVECNLAAIVKEVQSMYASRLIAGDVQVLNSVDETLKVSCRRSAISQVVANLLSNAIDAVQLVQGERLIHVQSLRHDGHVILRVSDNGPGVQQGMEESIFESFVTTKPDGKGTGLGLAISAKIMSEHGGHLSLNTSVSRSCFDAGFA